MISRRSFLAGILALGVAPAVVKASSIMRVRPTAHGWIPVDSWPMGDESKIITGEIGRYESVRFIESTPDIHAMIEAMKRQHIPPNKNGDYIMFVHPDNIRALRG